jgi:bacteriorhodopsin
MVTIDSANIWYWIGFFGMLIGTGLVYWMGRGFKKNQRYHINLALMITLVAAASYFALASGHGFVSTSHVNVYLARYIDWIITTPLLLLSLFVIASPAPNDLPKSRERFGLLTNIIFADVWMVATGLMASFSSDAGSKRFWFTVSCLGFIAIIWLMYGEVRNRAVASGPLVAKAYSSLLVFLSCVWIWYPIVWLFGTSGTNNISLYTENVLYAILDLLAKVVFCVFVISMLKGLRAEQPTPISE